MAKTRTVDVSGPRLRILRVALAHWAQALKRVASRVQGMGYHGTAHDMRRDRERIKGDDQNQGLLERLNPQQNLLDGESVSGSGEAAMNHDELRLSYFAVRKHRERILDLKRKNEKEEYETDEQDRDLELIGEPRGDDGEPSTGFLARLDLGWEENHGVNADQIDLVEGGGKSEPSGDPSDETEPSGPAGTGAKSSDTGTPSPATSDTSSSGEGDDPLRTAREKARDAQEAVMDHVRERLEEDPDVENKTLHEECAEQFPEAGIGDLTLRQFHARYPLQVKRAMAKEGS